MSAHVERLNEPDLSWFPEQLPYCKGPEDLTPYAVVKLTHGSPSDTSILELTYDYDSGEWELAHS